MIHVLAQGGGGGGATQYIQVGVWVLLLSLSFLGWLFRVIAQKRAESRVIMERRRREEELLRTGRAEDGSTPTAAVAPPAPPASADEAKRRLQELAQRRRAELQQMAERAQRGAQPAAGPRPAPSAPTAPGRPGRSPAEEARRRAAQQQKTAKARAAEAARQHREAAAQREQAQREQARREASGTTYEASRPSPAIARPTVSAADALAIPPSSVDAHSARPSTRSTMLIGKKPSIEDIRRAVVMSEVLAQPLSMRDAQEIDDAGPSALPIRRAG